MGYWDGSLRYMIDGFFLFSDSDYSETIEVPVSLSDDESEWNYYREVSEDSFVKIDYDEAKYDDYFLAARIVDCEANVLGLLFRLDDRFDFIKWRRLEQEYQR